MHGRASCRAQGAWTPASAPCPAPAPLRRRALVVRAWRKRALGPQPLRPRAQTPTPAHTHQPRFHPKSAGTRQSRDAPAKSNHSRTLPTTPARICLSAGASTTVLARRLSGRGACATISPSTLGVDMFESSRSTTFMRSANGGVREELRAATCWELRKLSRHGAEFATLPSCNSRD